MSNYPIEHRCSVCRCTSSESHMFQWSRRRGNRIEVSTYCAECRAEMDLVSLLAGVRLTGTLRVLMHTVTDA